MLSDDLIDDYDNDDVMMVMVVKHLYHLNLNEIILELLNYYLLKEQKYERIMRKFFRFILLRATKTIEFGRKSRFFSIKPTIL